MNLHFVHSIRGLQNFLAIPIMNTLAGFMIYTVYGKTFEGENFRGCGQNTLFTGKLSWCIRPMPLCTVHSK